ncbi:hypothetical protein HDU67_003255 [Dinochytrium kinnereticum]|nr:hypothetical protein HDU67_003255 [Dinochytrium kinnereticum]
MPSRSRSQPPHAEKARLMHNGEDVLALMDMVLSEFGQVENLPGGAGLPPASPDFEVGDGTPPQTLAAADEAPTIAIQRQLSTQRQKPMLPPLLSTQKFTRPVITLKMIAPAVVFSGPLFKLTSSSNKSARPPSISQGLEDARLPLPPPFWKLRHFALVGTKLYGFQSSLEAEPACMLLDLSWGLVEISVKEVPNAEYGVDTIITLRATSHSSPSSHLLSPMEASGETSSSMSVRHWVMRTSNQADARMWEIVLQRAVASANTLRTAASIAQESGQPYLPGQLLPMGGPSTVHHQHSLEVLGRVGSAGSNIHSWNPPFNRSANLRNAPKNGGYPSPPLTSPGPTSATSSLSYSDLRPPVFSHQRSSTYPTTGGQTWNQNGPQENPLVWQPNHHVASAGGLMGRRNRNTPSPIPLLPDIMQTSVSLPGFATPSPSSTGSTAVPVLPYVGSDTYPTPRPSIDSIQTFVSDSRVPSSTTTKTSFYAKMFSRPKSVAGTIVPPAIGAVGSTIEAAPVSSPRRAPSAFGLVRQFSKRSRSASVKRRKEKGSEESGPASAWNAVDGETEPVNDVDTLRGRTFN